MEEVPAAKTRHQRANERILRALLGEPDPLAPPPVIPDLDSVRTVCIGLPAGTLVLTADWIRRATGTPVSETFDEITEGGALERGYVIGDQASFYCGDNLNLDLACSAPAVFALFLNVYHQVRPEQRHATALEWGRA